MAKTVIIEIEFDHDDIEEADVYSYLIDLIEDESLSYEVVDYNRYRHKD